MRLKRIIIYPKGIQRITSKSERNGWQLIQKIISHLSEEKYHIITVEEFANYTGLPMTQVDE
ncbi:MAG: hypothetical protein JXR07_11060 [Reichenbachiella sp.]